MNYEYYSKVVEYLSFDNQKKVSDNDKKLSWAYYHMGLIKLKECYAPKIR